MRNTQNFFGPRRNCGKPYCGTDRTADPGLIELGVEGIRLRKERWWRTCSAEMFPYIKEAEL